MQDLTVALVQFDQHWESPSKNQGKIKALMEIIRNKKVDLVLLPEMFDTGFSMNTSLCKTLWNESEGIQFLKRISADFNTAIFTSLMAKTENGFVNRGVFVDAKGTIRIYDKRHLFAFGGEKAAFLSGSNEVVVGVNGWNVMLQICFDLRFPEGSRNHVKPGGGFRYDALLYVANWPAKRITHWDLLLAARALENQSYVCAVNRTGMDGNQIHYNGHSAIYSPEGALSASLLDKDEAVLCFTLSAALLSESRKNLPFLKERFV